MDNTIQLYIDNEKTKKGYPITSSDRVIDENGISVKEQLEQVVYCENDTNTDIDIPSGGGSGYIHPATHPSTMITGLSKVATSGDYNDLINIPTVGGGGSITIENTLEQYQGSTLNEKMVAMFNDINTNHRHTPMKITLPDTNIEITTNLVANCWKNKVFICDGHLIFKNCNGIIFDQMQFSKIYINRATSKSTTSTEPNGLPSLSEVNNYTYNGIKLSDCSHNTVEINSIIGFNVGLHLYSEIFTIQNTSSTLLPGYTMYNCGGTYYNDIFVNTIMRCKTGMLLSAGKSSLSTKGAGWVNENRIFNTSFDCNKPLQIGLAYGSRPSGEPVDAYQNNKFYNFGFEQVRDTVEPIAIDMKQGQSNSFINPRFEQSMSNSGYIFIKEGKNATMNRYDTSNYWMNINRIQLNTSLTKDDGSNQGKWHSVVIGSFIKEGTGILANKMTAIKGKTIYEGYGIDNYYFSSTDNTYSSPNNMINYTFADTEFAKFRTSNGSIKTIGYTS